MVMRPEDLRGMTSAQRDKLKKAELVARQKAQMNKAKSSTGKRPAPKMTMPLQPKRTRGATPVPMPTRSTKPGPAKKIAPGPKIKTPTAVTPKAKKPTLDDFLLKGKKPPMKIKPGLTRPSDADVILKGYNDKKTINKYKKGK